VATDRLKGVGLIAPAFSFLSHCQLRCQTAVSVGAVLNVQIAKTFYGRQPHEDGAGDHERLTKKTALAVFFFDALSSVAYSTEAILLVLLAAGTAAIAYLPFIAIA